MRPTVTIYQMGNDPRYHHAIWRMSQQHPGVVILHDVMMQHFFSGLVFHNFGLTRREYLELMERHHGEKGRTLAESHLHGLLGPEALGQQCPLTAGAVENALAVVVHSEAAFDLVPEEMPAAYLPLCAGAPAPPEVTARANAGNLSDQPFRISRAESTSAGRAPSFGEFRRARSVSAGYLRNNRRRGKDSAAHRAARPG